MAGHSKWHSIRHKKAANDSKRGKVLSKHSKIISVIARNDPNPDTNASLRSAIVNAKADSVPNDNIDRLLKKLSGEGKDAVQYQEVVYEGYGPNNISFVVTALTDNVKRTFPEVRTAFIKNGGNLGTSGTVMFQYDHVGIIQIKTEDKSEDDIMELLIEVEASDMNFGEEETEIITGFKDLARVRDALTKKGVRVIKAEPEYRAKTPEVLTDAAQLEKLENFIEKIEEIEDVLDVFCGFIPDSSLLTE